MDPEPDHAGTAGSKVAGAADGRPTDAGCRATAGTSQVAGAMLVLGVDCGSEEESNGEVMPVFVAFAFAARTSAAFATGIGAAAATAGGRGKPPELCDSTNAAAQNAIAAAIPHACARETARRTPA